MDATATPKSLAPDTREVDSGGGLSIVDKRALPRHLQQYLALQSSKQRNTTCGFS